MHPKFPHVFEPITIRGKVIGDALASGKMGDAVRGGYMAAMEIV